MDDKKMIRVKYKKQSRSGDACQSTLTILIKKIKCEIISTAMMETYTGIFSLKFFDIIENL
jgi:hypothetical protein